MLDNMLFLLRETVLPWFLALLVIQIVLLYIVKRKSSAPLRIMLYVLIAISILIALVAAGIYSTSSGFTHLADFFVSAGALIVYVAVLRIAFI